MFMYVEAIVNCVGNGSSYSGLIRRMSRAIQSQTYMMSLLVIWTRPIIHGTGGHQRADPYGKLVFLAEGF